MTINISEIQHPKKYSEFILNKIAALTDINYVGHTTNESVQAIKGLPAVLSDIPVCDLTRLTVNNSGYWQDANITLYLCNKATDSVVKQTATINSVLTVLDNLDAYITLNGISAQEYSGLNVQGRNFDVCIIELKISVKKLRLPEDE